MTSDPDSKFSECEHIQFVSASHPGHVVSISEGCKSAATLGILNILPFIAAYEGPIKLLLRKSRDC